jgi:spore germination cell wall hydrolase CwlJ-like protein
MCLYKNINNDIPVLQIMKKASWTRKKSADKRLALLLLPILVWVPVKGMADESTEQHPADKALEHWLSLYREVPGESEEIECLAQNIYFEARSESEQGQLAVGHVVMNRVASKNYPNSICSVVKQGGERRRYRCQFSWWCDGRSDQPMNRKAWQRSLALAKAIYRGSSSDPTGGALWYHAEYVRPVWSSALVFARKIGQHLFYLSREQPAYALNSS